MSKKNQSAWPKFKRLWIDAKRKPAPKHSYVLGFAFNEKGDEVLLLRKPRQQNKLNGLGGHIVDGEAPSTAMSREFLEECGLDVRGWEDVCSIAGIDWEMEVMCTFTNAIYKANDPNLNEEVLLLMAVGSLVPSDLFDMVEWLIPMALSMRNCKERPTYLMDVY